MSTKPKDTVRISRETAETALTELNNLLDYNDGEMETGGERAAIDDLWHALEDDDDDGDEPRTSVTSSGEFDKLAIAGVADGAVVIDYGQTPPRAVITTDGGEIPTDIIELPSADNEDDAGENDSSPETVAVDAPDNGGES